MDAAALSLGSQSMQAIGLILLPVLIPISIIGLLIGFLQAVTQIQDHTIGFIIKIVAVGVILYFIGPWGINTLADFVKNAYTMPFP